MTEQQRATLKTQLADLVFERVRHKVWLYWPPGPMMGQVFDRDRCAKEIAALVDKLVPTEPS